MSSGHVSVLVIDSVAALVPRSEIEGEMGDAQVGVQARLMSHVLLLLCQMTPIFLSSYLIAIELSVLQIHFILVLY